MPPLVVDVLNNYRERLLRDDEAALREMARAWLLVEQALRAEFEALAERAQRENLTPALLRRSARVRSLLAQTRIELERYADRVADQITAQQLRAGILGIDQAVGALNAVALQNGASISFDRLPVAAVENLVGLAGDGSPVRDVLRDATGIGVDAALRELLLGVAFGRNPLETARRMLRLGLGQSFSRMATIARTEKMRVWRQTTLQSYRNSPVVVGYRRLAAKSERTCLGCLFADGRFYRLDEEFDEHPNGRCTLVPVLDSAEPVDWETGQTWFIRQSEIMQREMLGPGRFELWRSGQVTLEDMVLRRSNPTWGGALVPKPVTALRGNGSSAAPPTQPTQVLAPHGIITGGAPPEWRPSMTREQAEGWAQDSSFQDDVYHITPIENVASLKVEGFDLTRRNFGRVWGNGAYVTPDPETAEMYMSWGGGHYNVERLAAKINVQNMLAVDVSKWTFDDDMHEFVLKRASVRHPGILDRYVDQLRLIRRNNEKIVVEAKEYSESVPPEQSAAAFREYIDRAAEEGRYVEGSQRAEAFTRTLVSYGHDALYITESMLTGPVGGNQIVIFDPQKVVLIDE